TLFGKVERWTETKEEKNPPKHYAEKVTSTIGEVTRDNLLYLKGKANIPVYKTLKELAGF
ncbi:ISLre2 family transposase, partial [Pallidibacillus thermolactis subsp. kokeshiiformis]|nr:ISLre2 family transposase [Pallidibacillus thermolactis subsp. kokeshiiformis]